MSVSPRLQQYISNNGLERSCELASVRTTTVATTLPLTATPHSAHQSSQRDTRGSAPLPSYSSYPLGGAEGGSSLYFGLSLPLPATLLSDAPRPLDTPPYSGRSPLTHHLSVRVLSSQPRHPTHREIKSRTCPAFGSRPAYFGTKCLRSRRKS